MVWRNKNIEKLQSGYLFPEINRRKKELLKEYPDANVISLGIGDTTLPLGPHVSRALEKAAKDLASPKTYSGYGDERGQKVLRERIAKVLYRTSVDADEVFVSDGAKCDIGRLQLLFGGNVTVAVQDPSYPVYIDGSVIMGVTGDAKTGGQFDRIRYMPCLPQNDFFPDLGDLTKTDIIYFCSPNNPTGAAATREQLADLVSAAKELSAILVFDAAYAEFIQDKNIPKSIYEIDGAREVAIEVNSFSKMIGFTGVRLGWTVVPKELKYQNGHSVNHDWLRVMTTIFNGASILAQQGGLAALEKEGREECHSAIQYYMNNVRMIAEKLQSLGLRVYGGKNAPYVWAFFPGLDSWDVFEEILTKTHIVTTPGSGFGPSGQGFVRFSAFGQKKNVEEAMDRLMNSKFSWKKSFK